MIRTHTLCLPEASLAAASALDDVVLIMAVADEVRLPPDFLDWVADEATTLVEAQLRRLFEQPEFAASLRRSDHRIALSQWVRHWVCPQIASRFESLEGRLPRFFAGQPGRAACSGACGLKPASAAACGPPGIQCIARASLTL